MISESDLRSIDPEIKDLMVSLDALPFVDKTHFSCWGHPETKDAVYPYFMLNYNLAESSNAFKFHTDLLSSVDEIKYATIDPLVKDFPDQCVKRTFEISASSKNLYRAGNEPSIESVDLFWNQVKSLVDSYSKK